MKNMQKTTLAAFAVIACAIVVLGIVFSGPKPESLGGTTKGDTSTRDLTVTRNATVSGTTTLAGVVSLTGTPTITGNLTATGSLNQIKGLVRTGNYTQISTTSATYTLSPSELCGSTIIDFSPLGAITTVTLPASSTTMFATCLPTVGSSFDMTYMSVSTSTVLAAGAGGTLGYTSSTTIAANKHGLLRISRNGANTYDIHLVNILN